MIVENLSDVNYYFFFSFNIVHYFCMLYFYHSHVMHYLIHNVI